MEENLELTADVEKAYKEIKKLKDELGTLKANSGDASEIARLKMENQDLKQTIKSKDLDQADMSEIFEQMVEEKDAIAAELHSHTAMINNNAVLSNMFERMMDLHKKQMADPNSETGDGLADLQKQLSKMEGKFSDSGEPTSPPSRRTQKAPARKCSTLYLSEANDWMSNTADMIQLEKKVEIQDGVIAKLEIDLSRCTRLFTQKKEELLKCEIHIKKLEETTEQQANDIKKLKNLHAAYRKKAHSVEDNIRKDSGMKGPPTPKGTLSVLAEDTQDFVDEDEQKAIVDVLVKSEMSHIAELMMLDTDFVTPLLENKLFAKNKDRLAKLSEKIKNLCFLHQNLHKLLVTHKKDFPRMVEQLGNSVVTIGPVLAEYLELAGTVLTADAPEKMIKFVDERKSNLLSTVSRSEMPRIPNLRLQGYLDILLLYKDITPHAHAHFQPLDAVISKISLVRDSVQEVADGLRQNVILTDLAEKIYNIPDEWTVWDPAINRKLLASDIMFYVFHDPGYPEATIADIATPLKHPISKSKQGETIRVFLFNDCVLLTTFRYKYRYRFECKEIMISQGQSDTVLMLQPDLFSDQDMKDMKDIDQGVACGSSTVLMCENLKQRYLV